uniref:CSON013504 protein n=1 Tax=Culicoides sonorensis TaxID=179676 RepID=A0A336LNI8_CULSO
MSSIHESMSRGISGSPNYGHSSYHHSPPQRSNSNINNNNNNNNSNNNLSTGAAQISKSNSNNSNTNGPQAQQFCLRWNNYQTNLTSVFDQLLQSESFVDVTLACDGHSIKAHKMVLSACSPYFQALFFDNPCQHPIIIMRDIKWAELKAAVEFMYKGEINVSQDQIGPLLKVAEMLKIRGLAEVNSDQDLSAEIPEISTNPTSVTPYSDEISIAKKQRLQKDCPIAAEQMGESESPPINTIPKMRKRRWPSADCSSIGSPSNSVHENMEPPSPLPPSVIQQPNTISVASTISPPFPVTPTQLDSMSALPLSHDEMEIKPGIAEMIREEERAKLLENSQAWLGAPSSSIAGDSYQYQLQNMWQKCWNSQNLIHHLRFRERGPLKSWRPETMAEAIFSVLKEGLSLSQAARKFDIPYPTFVLYANRVHNMLGPSIDGGTDLRPKGRGRPQRILLGIWPDEHIKGVIKSVVFRDAKDLKEEMAMYGRHSPFPFQDGPLGYQTPTNGIGSQMINNADPMSSDAVSAAMSAVRQQMCNMVAAAQQHHSEGNNVIGGFHLPSHLSVHPNISIPKLGSPENLTPTKSHVGSPTSVLSHMQHQNTSSSSSSSSQKNNSQQQNFSSRTPTRDELCHNAAGLSITRLASPSNDAHDLRIISPEISPPTSPNNNTQHSHMERTNRTATEGASSNMHFERNPDPDSIRHNENNSNNKKNSSPTSLLDSYKDTPIKIEADCRGE